MALARGTKWANSSLSLPEYLYSLGLASRGSPEDQGQANDFGFVQAFADIGDVYVLHDRE